MFKIICRINVDVFERLLTHHQNFPLVDSVLIRLCKGFWPFADTMKRGYPKSWDKLGHLLTLLTDFPVHFGLLLLY